MSALHAADPTAADGRASGAPTDGPWPAPVAGFVAPTEGEHPRLFFRKGQLAELRKRAQTPAGKAIIARLRILLGNNGEAMPTAYQHSKVAYENADKDLPIDAYTLWHAAGFGFLYQLTGKQTYADLGRQCVEKAFAGQRDRDDRYAFRDPGGFLRAGPSVGAIAIAYDWCYDGWDAEFRATVAKELLHYDGGMTKRDGGGQQTIERMATSPKLIPGSNHWGPQIGGAALAMLAIRHDPGVDDVLVRKYLDSLEKLTVKEMTEGWGDHGEFAEGDGPGTIASDTALIMAMQAWKVAGGKDFITPRPNVPWMTLKWIMGTLPDAKGFNATDHGPLATAKLINPANGWPRFILRGNYPQNVFNRSGQSGSGTFAQGFGAIPAAYKPALLWTYNHCVAPIESDYDAISYPHRAALALINWPIDMAEANPSTVLPNMVADEKWGRFLFRNRWQDADDIVISLLPQGHKGHHPVPGGDMIIWGMGQHMTVPCGFQGRATKWNVRKHGGEVSNGSAGVAVDFSGAGGAEGVIVLAGPKAGDVKVVANGPICAQVVSGGTVPFAVITLAKNTKHPTATAAGDTLTVSGQTFTWADGALHIGK